MKNILHLTLKKKWFDMIASGEKREEYREIKAYWADRLELKCYDYVRFRNGYSANSPTMLVQFLSLATGIGYEGWGAPKDKPVYIIRLGSIIERPFTQCCGHDPIVTEWRPGCYGVQCFECGKRRGNADNGRDDLAKRWNEELAAASQIARKA
jgi:hypothetical protein